MHIYPKEFKQINENNKQNTCSFTNFLPFLSYCGAFIRLSWLNSPPSSWLINMDKCLPILPDVSELGLEEMITKDEFSWCWNKFFQLISREIYQEPVSGM